ncbi:MAG TPA: fatty acid desaturase, partial [Nitrosopumilaceae archaeon]|nr:fatty acid desaturase [Nitrosopumilaceae archaeon]
MSSLLLFLQWKIGFHWFLYIPCLYFAVSVAVIAHNHNHVPIWKSSVLNHMTDYWITLFYGFPAFAWTPTHNKNHHKFNNREGDYTITYRFSEANNIFTLLTYPSISSYFQQSPILNYLRYLWNNKRQRFFISIFQYVALGLFIGITLMMDWRKSLLYVIIPQQFALFSVLIFNYIQHVHADENSKYNHSRNFVSKYTNFMLFNNGYHTAHHHKASTHWSQLPQAHEEIAPHIDSILKEKFIWGFLFKAYILGPFNSIFRTKSMRLIRKANEELKSV